MSLLKKSDRSAASKAVLKEVGLLSRQVGAVVKAAAKSREAKQLEARLAKDLHRVGSRILKATRQAQKSKSGRELRGHVQRVLATAKTRTGQAKQEFRGRLIERLRGLQKQLDRASERIHKK